MSKAEGALGREPSPRVSPFADAQDGAQLLQRAGFALPVADSDVVTVRYNNVFGLFRDLKAMGETAAFTGPRSRPLTRTLIARAADIYARDYSDPDGRIRATFEIVTLTGWAPHESQQKPLARGSAKMRLADALGVGDFSGRKAQAAVMIGVSARRSWQHQPYWRQVSTCHWYYRQVLVTQGS
jgi:hypothetical protein